MLHIRMLGDFCSIQVDEKPLSTVNKPRLHSLLAYLILHRDAPQFRYHLAAILWPDSSQAQAFTNLRNLVHLLRRALPDGDRLILATNQTLQWNPEIPVQVDLIEFQHYLGENIQEAALENLEAALRLYQGDLLTGCYDDWVAAQRADLQRDLVKLLCELSQRYEYLRRYADAISCAQRLVEIEPFDKTGIVRLMGLSATSGDVPSALKTYQAYARMLQRELGAEPEEDVREFYARLVHGGQKTQPRGAAQSPQEVLPLVGRAAEWQAIQAFWKSTSAGKTGMLILGGEAGIGKSRLAEELVGWAARQGMRTATAHCYSSEGSLPYAPVVTWLRSLGLPVLDKVWQTELARLLPELHSKQREPLAPLTEAWQRMRLFEALAKGVVGGRQKTILLIDDLQWADQDTLEWLHYLLRFDPTAPLLVVGTLRSEEAVNNPACTRLLSGLQQDGHHLEMELGPLNEHETHQLADAVAGKPLEGGIGALLFQETEGNPLFIVETVRVELYKNWQLPGVQPLPYKTRAVLESRIRQLSSATREVALLAATIGRAFSFEVLSHACDAREKDVINAIDELLQRRIVREMGQDAYLFNHDKLRDAVLVDVSSAHRRLLHRQVAESLLHCSQDQVENRFGEIAGHYEQAGNEQAAFKYYLLAADSARNLFANDRAIRYYQCALGLCTDQNDQPIASAKERAYLYEKCGEVQALIGAYPQAETSFRTALQQPFPSSRLWRSQVYRKISDALSPKYEHDQAFVALTQAEEALALQDGNSTLSERQEWLQIQLSRSQLHYWANHPDEMDAIIQRIRPMLQQDGRPDQQTELLSQQYMARMRHERYRLSDETVEIARQRLKLTEGLAVSYDTAWAQFMLGFGLLWHGDPLAAREYLNISYEKASQMGAKLLQVRCLAYLSIASRYLGDRETLQKQLPDFIRLATAINEFSYLGIGYAIQGWIAWRAGQPATARDYCSAAYDMWKKSGGDMFHCLADWVVLAMAVSDRDLAQAEAAGRALLTPDPFSQPVLAPTALKLEEALRACEEREIEKALSLFQESTDLARASHEL